VKQIEPGSWTGCALLEAQSPAPNTKAAALSSIGRIAISTTWVREQHNMKNRRLLSRIAWSLERRQAR
jgi:hypothetical protein